jgi:hypothetical protein
MQPRTSLPTARPAENWEDGAGSRQRPAGSDGFDPTCTRIWPGPGDVIVQEHHERLARWYSSDGNSD